MSLSNLPNRDLIERLVDAGPDDPLWPEFIRRFRGRLRLVVFRCYATESARSPGLDTEAPAEAVDDLTQDVFLRLLDSDRRALSRFRGRSEHSAYTYLNAIAVNLVRDHFKKLRAAKKPRTSASLSSPVMSEDEQSGTYGQTLAAEGPGAERFVVSSELRGKIRRAVDELSPKGATSARDRLVFQLFFVEGLTVDEIASNRSIGLSPSGVEKCIRRIRDALRKKLGADLQ